MYNLIPLMPGCAKVLEDYWALVLSTRTKSSNSLLGMKCIKVRRLHKKGRYQSGQLERIVNPLAYAFVGSNPTRPKVF